MKASGEESQSGEERTLKEYEKQPSSPPLSKEASALRRAHVADV